MGYRLAYCNPARRRLYYRLPPRRIVPMPDNDAAQLAAPRGGIDIPPAVRIQLAAPRGGIDIPPAVRMQMQRAYRRKPLPEVRMAWPPKNKRGLSQGNPAVIENNAKAEAAVNQLIAATPETAVVSGDGWEVS